MSTRERPRRGVLPPAQENIEKIAKVVKDGNCYGAQQMYKSTSARYISAERYSEALDILHSGSCIQLEHGQIRASLVFSGVLDIFCAAKSCFLVLFLSVELQLCRNLKVVCRTCQFQTCLSEHKVNYFKLTCGSELALLFVETLVKGKYPYDEDTLDRVRKIYKKFPRIPVPQHLDLGDDDDMQKLSEALGAAKVRVECCSSFLKAAIKWSAEVGAHRNGSPELHDMLAEYIYSESPEADMARVSYHFVRGKHPRKFASTLVNFMGKCYPGEDDVAIARAILMYLSHGNLRDSNCLMDELKKQLKGKDLDFPKSDLIQLINFLLQTLQRDALPLFNMLRQTYKSSIDREPVFNELLDVIAEKFYEVPRRNPLMQGMFGDIFKMMGGDGM